MMLTVFAPDVVIGHRYPDPAYGRFLHPWVNAIWDNPMMLHGYYLVPSVPPWRW